MEIKKIKKNKKIIAYIYLCLDYKKPVSSKDKFISFLIKDIVKSPIGYAGFKTKKSLQRHLINALFGWKKDITGIPESHFNKKLILEIIEKSIKKCHQFIPSDPTRIFIFPSFNPFKKEKMFGVGGFCPGKNAVLIDINPVSGWQTALEKTVYHEFNHSIVSIPFNQWTLLDSLVFEGLADNFAEELSNGKTSPWVKACSEKSCREYFFKIKKLLSSKSYKTHQAVFFANIEYPLWLGYSMGYQIVKSFLKKNPELKWKDIMKLGTKEIAENFTKG
jgi:uncharacterized protein YjaZ